MQSEKKKDGVQETVLLRHARPKYDFKGTKLAKNEKTFTTPSTKIISQNSRQSNTNVAVSLPNRNPTLPVRSVPVVSVSRDLTVISKTETGSHSPLKLDSDSAVLADHDSRRKTAGVVKPLPVSSLKIGEGHQTVQLPQKPIQIVHATGIDAGASNGESFTGLPTPNHSATSVLLADQVRKLENDKLKLKQDLDVQIKVNGELKKLLVASVGEDLERRVERLVRERAELSLEVGGFSKKVTEDYENLDKVSIQADMWRSKFLASRVMIDELASARAFYALQYQESQGALQQLLTERHELRANLLESFKCLQLVKGAFDPLNAHRSTDLPSTNVLDLAKKSQQLAEAIRYRLLPGQLNVQTVIDIDGQLENCMTHAENFAQQLVSKEASLDPVQKSVSGNLFGPSAGSSVIQRYHPQTSYDNVTVNCCAKCKGEINVL